MPKLNTSDYETLPLSKWNITTFRAYMSATHETKYGIPYVANNYAIEGRFLKDMQGKYGNKALKAFIDRCFTTHKTSAQYPGLNFGFMYSFLRGRNLPIVLKEIQAEEAKELRRESAQITDIDGSWF